MGKFNNSDMHNKYSDWHWQLVKHDDKYKRLYQCDIDRLWIEYDFNNNEIVAVIDIKREGTDEFMTPTEKGVYEWFSKNGADCYVVYINDTFTSFRVVSVGGSVDQTMASMEYADWLLSLRNDTHITQSWKDIPF